MTGTLIVATLVATLAAEIVLGAAHSKRLARSIRLHAATQTHTHHINPSCSPLKVEVGQLLQLAPHKAPAAVLHLPCRHLSSLAVRGDQDGTSVACRGSQQQQQPQQQRQQQKKGACVWCIACSKARDAMHDVTAAAWHWQPTLLAAESACLHGTD